MTQSIQESELVLTKELAAAIMKAKDAGVGETYIAGSLERMKITALSATIFAYWELSQAQKSKQ